MPEAEIFLALTVGLMIQLRPPLARAEETVENEGDKV